MALRPKAPLDVLDYTIPLPAGTVLLAGETIFSATVTPAPAGITLGAATPGSGGLVVWISGGEAMTVYALICSATTSQGRLIAWTSSIYVGPEGLDDPSVVAPASTLR